MFPNCAGNTKSIDELLTQELRAAGIEVLVMPVVLNHPEVHTKVLGHVNNLWTFRRHWYYWSAEGPGIPVDAAMKLHETHGKDCRVDGHCDSPSPLEWFKGLGVGYYHVDTPEALKALADTIKSVLSSATKPKLDGDCKVDHENKDH